MNSEPSLRPAPSLQEIHTTLRTLYEREYHAGPPPHLFEILLPKLPEFTRELVDGKLDTIVQAKVKKANTWADIAPEEREALAAFFGPVVLQEDFDKVKDKVGAMSTFTDLTREERGALAAFFDPVVLQEHLEVGRDSILSSVKNPVTHCDTQSSIVAHKLITVAAGGNPAYVERMGCVFFDADGTKTIVDCTSHAHAGKYLEELAAFLCHPPSPVQQWLQERHLHTETYSYAGDELIVIVHSDAQTIDKKGEVDKIGW